MDRWVGRVALVTGGSMGVGEATVRMLASQGMKVATCARSEDKLSKLADEIAATGRGEVLPIRVDLRNEGEILAMFEKIKSQWGGVDVCINNAGLALNSTIIDGDTELWNNMWDVNVRALCLCSRESVKSMRERGVDDGHIINMNSLSGHRAGKSHVYSATKYAVTSLSEGLRWELRAMNSHIRVTSISPGLIKSNFAYTMLDDDKAADDMYESRQALSTEEIANIIQFVLASPASVQVSELMVRPVEQAV